MADQHALFGEADQQGTRNEPRGFRYQEEIITPGVEATLAAELNEIDLKPFEFHGHIGNRRVANFGFKYDFAQRSIRRVSDVPSFLDDLLERAARFAGCAKTAFQQVGVNEYRTGAGIGWHKDKPDFGIIIGISLLAPATMRFRRRNGERWIRMSHTLKPRSVYILSGESRTEWEHSIPALDALRYSITFRTLSDKHGMPRPRG